MNAHRAMRLAWVIGLGFGAPHLAAQSVTVITSGNEARQCVSAADVAARMHIAGWDDVEQCTFAIERGRLRQRDLAATYNNRGIIKGALERYQEAFEDYNNAIRTMPDLPEPYVGRGNIYFLANKMERMALL